MNIFVLDKDPQQAVMYLCDAHVVKMTLETCQLLCTYTYLQMKDSGCSTTPVNKDWPRLYLPTHQNHPCSRCLSNCDNYYWLVSYFNNICKEYTHRYGRVHSCQIYADTWFRDLYRFEDHRLSFPKCMPDEYKVGKDDIDSVIESYRNYYKFKKNNLSRFYYTNRYEPYWIK